MNAEQLIRDVEIEYKIKKLLIFNQPSTFWNSIKIQNTNSTKSKKGGKNGRARN